MKKLALFLAVAMLLVSLLTACEKNCHACGESYEEGQKIGSHNYCTECIAGMKVDMEDLDKEYQSRH